MARKKLPRPPQWVLPRPRDVMTVRVHREYKDGLNGIVEKLQAEGWSGLKTAHVVEALMQNVITEEGWARIEAALRANPDGFRPPMPKKRKGE